MKFLLTSDKLSVANPQQLLEHLTNSGHSLVITVSTAVDYLLFQQDVNWLKDMLLNGRIFIEMDFNSPTESLNSVTEKIKFWETAHEFTNKSVSFDDAIGYLINEKDIQVMADLVREYGIPKSAWQKDQQSIFNNFPGICEKLGLDPRISSKTEMFMAAQAQKKLHIFEQYKRMLYSNIALQHGCFGFVNCDGSITRATAISV